MSVNKNVKTKPVLRIKSYLMLTVIIWFCLLALTEALGITLFQSLNNVIGGGAALSLLVLSFYLASVIRNKK
jgi:hypothetical protein